MGNEGKNGAIRLCQYVFETARRYPPAVIYMDDVDEIFPLIVKGKKGPKIDPAKHPSRIKPFLIPMKNEIKRGAEATEEDRILFIGCMWKPVGKQDTEVDQVELEKTFDEKIWVNYPDYGSRVVLWQNFMMDHGVFVDPTKFNI